MKFLDPVQFKIVDKLDGIELAEYEHEDLLLLEAVAFHSGVNKNKSYIEKADAEKDIDTFNGKPIRILWNGYDPTGHGYNPTTNTFSDKVNNIGYVCNAFVEDGNGDDYEAKIQAVVWESYYPEIAERLRELHSAGELKFSIEAERDFEIGSNGNKKCYNINFRGLSIVAKPAWERTRSTMVAEDENTGQENGTGKTSTNDEGEGGGAKATPTHEPSQPSPIEPPIPNPTPKIEDLDVKATLIEMQAQNKNLENQLNEYKTIVEGFQQEKLGNERLSKLARFGEQEKTAEELGKMSAEDFNTHYENVLNAYAKSLEEGNPVKHHDDDVIKGLFHKATPEKDERETLLDIFNGLGK